MIDKCHKSDWFINVEQVEQLYIKIFKIIFKKIQERIECLNSAYRSNRSTTLDFRASLELSTVLLHFQAHLLMPWHLHSLEKVRNNLVIS